MPQQQFGGQYLHPSLAEMAAAYLFHITQNHAFNDGNKRTAALTALIFLDVNGAAELPSPDKLERVILAVASGELTKDGLSDWMRAQWERA